MKYLNYIDIVKLLFLNKEIQNKTIEYINSDQIFNYMKNNRIKIKNIYEIDNIMNNLCYIDAYPKNCNELMHLSDFKKNRIKLNFDYYNDFIFTINLLDGYFGLRLTRNLRIINMSLKEDLYKEIEVYNSSGVLIIEKK
jgi:hypothetical protein